MVEEMAAIAQVKCQWAGSGVVGLAFTTFYVGSGGGGIPTGVNAIAQFFNGLKALLPAAVSITVPASGQSYDDVTGQLLGTWGGPPVQVIQGTGTGALASASGASIRWLTGVVVRRHQLVGRSFIVPMVGSAFNTNGVIAPANQTILVNAAALIPGSGAVRVWSRPSAANSHIGASAVISGASVSNVGSILRSRRQ